MVEIHDLDLDTVKVVSCEKDCNGELELSVYRSVLQFNDVITMGKTIGMPVK